MSIYIIIIVTESVSPFLQNCSLRYFEGLDYYWKGLSGQKMGAEDCLFSKIDIFKFFFVLFTFSSVIIGSSVLANYVGNCGASGLRH